MVAMKLGVAGGGLGDTVAGNLAHRAGLVLFEQAARLEPAA
jgi:hypothetical protein